MLSPEHIVYAIFLFGVPYVLMFGFIGYFFRLIYTNFKKTRYTLCLIGAFFLFSPFVLYQYYNYNNYQKTLLKTDEINLIEISNTVSPVNLNSIDLVYDFKYSKLRAYGTQLLVTGMFKMVNFQNQKYIAEWDGDCTGVSNYSNSGLGLVARMVATNAYPCVKTVAIEKHRKSTIDELENSLISEITRDTLSICGITYRIRLLKLFQIQGGKPNLVNHHVLITDQPINNNKRNLGFTSFPLIIFLDSLVCQKNIEELITNSTMMTGYPGGELGIVMKFLNINNIDQAVRRATTDQAIRQFSKFYLGGKALNILGQWGTTPEFSRIIRTKKGIQNKNRGILDAIRRMAGKNKELFPKLQSHAKDFKFLCNSDDKMRQFCRIGNKNYDQILSKTEF